MTALAKYTEQIKQLCLKHKVKRLYAFGAVLTDSFNESSDVDFIVNFKPTDIELYADNYYNLKFSLEVVLKKQIDLLEEKAIKNPYFRQVVDQQRQLIYGHRN